MRRVSHWVLGLLAAGAACCAPLSAEVTFDTDRPDLEALEKYIQDLRSRTLNKKLSYLSIAGDVRVSWRDQRGERHGRATFGVDGKPSRQQWKAEANLLLDIGRLPSWGMMKLNFNDKLGSDIDSKTAVSLQRALVGYDFVDSPCRSVYIQGGREGLFDDFDSRIEFNANYDGFMFNWTEKVAEWGDYYIKGGPLIVDYRKNNYGWVVETGVEDLGTWGPTFKVSLIDWGNEFRDVDRKNNTSFVVVQYLASYWWEFAWCKAPLEIYAAYLQNYAAKPLAITLHRKEDKGWYAGFTFGKLRNAGDWVIDLNYQWVQALAIPQFDLSGIGLGAESPMSGFFKADRASQAQGNSNYKGVAFKGSVNFTKSLIGQLKWEFSQPIITQIGGRGFYQKTQLQMMFAF
jgi:hypothetical protein